MSLAVIELESPFKGVWRKGYLVVNKEPRRNIILFNNEDDRTTIPYARYLKTVEIGNFIPDGYEVDHIDSDPMNDALENLQILTVEEHKEKTARESSVLRYELVCKQCGTIFFKQESRISKKAKGVFCSKSCVGKHTTSKESFCGGKKKVKDEDILKIKSMYSEGMTAYRIGKILGISAVTAMKYIRQ